MAAAWQNESRLNHCWRATTYPWKLPVLGAIPADLDAPASAYNCFAEARLGSLVQCSRQAIACATVGTSGSWRDSAKQLYAEAGASRSAAMAPETGSFQ